MAKRVSKCLYALEETSLRSSEAVGVPEYRAPSSKAKHIHVSCLLCCRLAAAITARYGYVYGIAHLPAGVGNLATSLADYRDICQQSALLTVVLTERAVSNASGEEPYR